MLCANIFYRTVIKNYECNIYECFTGEDSIIYENEQSIEFEEILMYLKQ